MRKIGLIAFCFLISLYGCESYTWQVGHTPDYPKTHVKDFVKGDGFLFPAGSSVYDFITCLNLGSYTSSDTKIAGDYSTIKVEYSLSGNTETRVLTLNGNGNCKLTFVFDLDKGIIKDEKTNKAIFIRH